MVSATSCPYAPTFCTGVPPTLPGMPLKHSTPAQRAMTDRETNLSQATPAPASKITLPFSSCPPRCSMPSTATFSTSPDQPASATTRLLPPPRTKRGRSRERANVTASRTSPTSLASTKYLAGPPISLVVNGASGMFSSSCTNHFHLTHRQEHAHTPALNVWLDFPRA